MPVKSLLPPFSRFELMNKTKISTSLLALLMIAGAFAGCLGGETIDDTARTDIDDLSASTTENQTTMNADMDSIELDVTALSNSLGSLSSDLTSLGNDLTAKETALLGAISTAEASIASLETHNSALMTTLSGMNDSNSAESQSLQAQITTNAANIATLSTDLQTLTTELAAVQSSLAALSSTVTSLESTLTSVESMATQNAADVDELETTSATNAAAIADLVDQITILTEDIEILWEVLEDLGNPNEDLFNDNMYTNTVEYDWDGDGVVDYIYSFNLSIMDCMDVSFEDLSYIDFTEAYMGSINFRYVDLSFTNLSNVWAEPIPCSGAMSSDEDNMGDWMDKTVFMHSDLSHMYAVGAQFPASAWVFSTLDYANFSYVDFSPLQWSDGLNFSSDWWDDPAGNFSYFEGNSAISSVFTGANLFNSTFYMNNITMATFNNANLGNSSFYMNDLTNTNFTGADLSQSKDRGDNVWDGANFAFADLTNSTINYSNSTGINWFYTTCPNGSSSGSSGSC